MASHENATASNQIEAGLFNDLSSLLDTEITNTDQLIQTGTLLGKTIRAAIEQGIGDNLAARFTQEQIAAFRDLHSRYEIETDRRIMDNILNGTITTPDAYPFQSIYDRIGLGEGRAAGLSKGDRVLHIGSGWPGTTIGLYRQLGIPVTCVEIDPEVADRSRRALDKLGLLGPDKLQVVHYDGKQINPEGFKAVIIAAMVPTEDKRAIVKNLRDLAVDSNHSPLLVLRTPVDHLRSMFYQHLPPDLLQRDNSSGVMPFADTSQFFHYTDPLRSIVYRIKPMSAIRRGDDRLILAASRRLAPVA